MEKTAGGVDLQHNVEKPEVLTSSKNSKPKGLSDTSSSGSLAELARGIRRCCCTFQLSSLSSQTLLSTAALVALGWGRFHCWISLWQRQSLDSPSRSSASCAGCARASAPLEKPGGDDLHHHCSFCHTQIPSPPSTQPARIISTLQAHFILCFPLACSTEPESHCTEQQPGPAPPTTPTCTSASGTDRETQENCLKHNMNLPGPSKAWTFSGIATELK